MTNTATIDHNEVHIDLSDRSNTAVSTSTAVTTQPAPVSGTSGVQFNKDAAMATFTQSPTPIVAQKPDPDAKPKDFVNTSCCVVFTCNFIAGLIAYHFGVKSNWAWKLGQVDVAKKQSKRALIFVILGIIAGLVTYITVFYLYFVVHKGQGYKIESGSTQG